MKNGKVIMIQIASLLAVVEGHWLSEAIAEFSSGKNEIFFGTNRRLGDLKPFIINKVYFKLKGEIYTEWFSDLTGTTDMLPPPDRRLAGSETQEYRKYYGFRPPVQLPRRISLTDLVHARTGRHLMKATPGSVLIQPPF
jgi:hypothetical protein